MAVTDLGSAVQAFAASGAARAGDRLHLVSRNLSPTRVVTIDLDDHQVVDTDTTTAGEGAWAVASASDGVYLGTFGGRGRGNLLRYRGGSLQIRAAIDANYIWDLAAGPGVVYGVTSDPAIVFAFDTGPGLARVVGAIDPAAGEVGRTCSTRAGRLVVGGSRRGRALLVETDADGGGRRSILPAALAGDRQVYAARHTSSGRVAVGTVGPLRDRPAVALIDPAAPDQAVVVRLPREGVVDTVAEMGGRVYATARPSGGLYAVDPAGPGLWRLEVPVPGSETRALLPVGGDLVGTSADGSTFRYTPAGGALEVHTPGEMGLPAGAQLVQSLTVSRNVAWAGGNFAVQRRRLTSSGTVQRWFVPGEPKDIVVAEDGTAYLAMYPIGEIWSATPGDTEPRRLTSLPTDQLRPITLVWVPDLGCLAVTTTNDLGQGALHTVDPVTGRVDTIADPLGAGGPPAGLTVHGTLCFVGGSGGAPGVIAWHLVQQRVVWQVSGIAPAGGFVLGMGVSGSRLYTLSSRGEAAVIDLGTRAVTARRRIAPTAGRLRVAGQRVLAVTGDRLLELDRTTLEPTLVADGLASEVWGWPPLAVDESDRVYVVRGRQIARVT